MESRPTVRHLEVWPETGTVPRTATVILIQLEGKRHRKADNMHWRKRVTINLFATWGDHVVGMVICLVLMPFSLRVLGDGNYGLWVFVNAFAGYSGLLNLGFGQTICRYFATYRAQGDTERENRVVNLIGAIYLGLGGVALIIAGVAAWLAPVLWPQQLVSITELRTVILLLGVNAAIAIVGSLFGGVLIGLQRWDLERAILTSSGIARLALTLMFLHHESGLLTLAWITVATTLVENIGLVLTALRKAPELRFGRRYLSRETLRECVQFSGFSLLDSLAGKLVENTDSIVIGIVLGPLAIVPFNVATRLCQAISKPLQLIGQICLPQAGAYHASGETQLLRELLTKGMGLAWLLVTGYFIGTWYFGPLLMETWLHKSYPESQMLLLVLLFAQLVGTPMKVVSGVLYGMGEPRRPALSYLTEALAKVALSLLLIYPFGLLGAAISTAIPMIVVELGVLLPFALRRLKLPLVRVWNETIAPQLLPLSALWAYSAIVTATISPTPGWPKLLAIAGGGAVVLGTVWMLQRVFVRAQHRKWLQTNPSHSDAESSAAL